MRRWPRRSGEGEVRRRTGVTVSIVAHLVVAGMAACWSTSVPPAPREVLIDGRWESQRDSEPLLESVSSPEVVQHPAAGQEMDLQRVEVTSVDGLDVSPTVPESWGLPVATTAKRPLKARQRSSGKGQNFGNGDGDQPGFFGLQPAPESRIVFVVDHSRSMNHPHDSPAKTRYGRVKMELVKCILEMHDRQSFFVVFFGNEMTAMPGNQLCPSIPGARDPYLQWIVRLPSGGQPTNPLPALDYGLRMRPDVLCFLTDGDFEPRIKRRLVALKQSNTVVHTFAFGEVDAEETLKPLASNNRGEYRFVP